MNEVLVVSGLCKRFGAISVASDITLKLPSGARHALIGPNGAGKSTLVGMLSGVIRPDSGIVSLLGVDITKSSCSSRVRHGLVRTFQISSLFNEMSVAENLYLALSEHARTSKNLWYPASQRKELIDKAHELTKKLGIQALAEKKINEIAYGQQRLVEIALALALEPRVLLLDEPAAGIPSAEVDVLLDAIDGLSSEIAVLMIEHDMQLVRRFATEITVLVQGKVLMTGSPTDVMTSDEVRRVYLGDAGHKRFHSDATHA